MAPTLPPTPHCCYYFFEKAITLSIGRPPWTYNAHVPSTQQLSAVVRATLRLCWEGAKSEEKFPYLGENAVIFKIIFES